MRLDSQSVRVPFFRSNKFFSTATQPKVPLVAFVCSAVELFFLELRYTSYAIIITNFNEMACATLKRSLDWDSINQRPNKRRRCGPFGSTSANSNTNTTTPQIQPGSSKLIVEPTPSAFNDATCTKLTPGM